MGYADEQEYSFSMERFTGIDQGMEGNDTPLHASRSAYNCDTSGGALRLAQGWAYDNIGRAPGEIRSLMRFFKRNADGTDTVKIVAATDGGLWCWNGSAWEDIAGSSPVTSGRFSSVNYQRKDEALLIMANGSDNVYCWNGEGKIEKLAKDADWVQGQPMWDESADVIRLNRHGLINDGMVVFEKHEGALPTNISEKDTYFVHSDKLGPDTFKVSATKPGGAVNLKGNGKVGWRMARAKWLPGGSPSANASTDTITLPSHGLMTDDGVVFDHFSGSLPGGIKLNTTYYAIVTSPNEFMISTTPNNPEDYVNIGSAGSGEWKVRKAALDAWLHGAPSAGKNTGIFTLTNHGLTEKDKNDKPMAVEFGVEPSDVLPGGISAEKVYYVNRIDGNNFTLSEKVNGPILDITSAGGGGWAMRAANADEWMSAVPSINLSSNVLTLAGHGFADDAPVVFGIADENSYVPDGLYAGHTYYVKRISGSEIQLLSTPGAYAPVGIKSAGMSGWALRKLGVTAWLPAPSVNIATNVITMANHGLVNGDAVTPGIDGSRLLPGGLTAGTTYYVRDVQTDTFRLSTIKNGSAINLTIPGRTGWRIRPDDGVWRLGLPTYNDVSEVITLKSHGFKNGDPVVVDIPNADGFMPGGIKAHDGTPQGQYYYIVKPTASTFMVSEKPGGDPVITTSAGSNAFRVRVSRMNRPLGGSLALHRERVWIAGDKSRPNSAFFSDDSDPTNWAIGVDDAGEMVNPSWDGDAVTAVANLFDNIVVFKSSSMFRIVGTNPGEYQTAPVLSTVGTVSPATICQWQNAAFFLSPRGIMVYNGIGCEPLGGDALKDFWATMNTQREALAGACATIYNAHLLVALPAGKDGGGHPVTYNNAVVDFDIAAGAFMLRTGIRVDSWLPGDTLRFASGDRICIWGEDSAGNKVHTYGGSIINMKWETPESDFGSRDSVKTVTCVSVTGRDGALKVTVTADGKSPVTKTLQLLDDPDELGTAKARFNIFGRLITIALENVNGSNIEISGVTVFYERDDD
jgi:hypothetical protein